MPQKRVSLGSEYDSSGVPKDLKNLPKPLQVRDNSKMRRIVQPLLFLFARCTRNELIRHIEWLKAENEMLRKRVDKKRIFLEPEEKSRLC